MDYDVAAIALATPPASAPVQSFRPAVAVKNLGIHDADVTGTLSIYDRAAGTLIVTMLLTARSIAPGETRNAVANQLWEPTPADIGRAFLFTAVIVYPPDQNLSNNNLQPTTVIVTAAPPTPPPPVEAHADQHEDGGGDQLTVEGLSGKLAEGQTPTEHASSHEDGGADQLDVAGLVGELATAQTPKLHASTHQVGGTDAVAGIEPGAHASSHEPGGDDELSGIPPTTHASRHEFGGTDVLNLTSLSGALADAQVPLPHESTHVIGATDALTQVIRAIPNAYVYNGPFVNNVNPGSWVSILQFAFVFAAPVKRALLLVMVEATIPPDPTGNQASTIRASVNNEYNGFTISNQINNPQWYQRIPMTLFALQVLQDAAQTWTVDVAYFGYGGPHAAQVTGLIILPCD